MPTRVKVRNPEMGTAVDMDLEPDSTVQEVLDSAAGYWGKVTSEYALRRGPRVLRARATIVEASLQDGDLLEFVTVEVASRPTLFLEVAGHPSLEVKGEIVLGRRDLESFLGDRSEGKWISRRQLSFTLREGAFYVEDGADGTPSTNGTTVNGQDIRGRGRSPLRDGDGLGVGGALEFRVRVVQPE